MKSIIKKTLYTGLGLLSEGTAAAQSAAHSLGKEIAKKADISEAEGEKVARKLQAESARAVKSLRRTLDTEVTKVTDTIHSVIHKGAAKIKPKPAPSRKAAPKASAKKYAKAAKAPKRHKTA